MLENKPHDLLVAQIGRELKKCFDLKEKAVVYHGGTNSTRPLEVGANDIIDISGLNHVLSINTAERYAIVEPNVPMDKLVEETLKHGLVPPVVMEFPSITVGGGIQGGAGESSSFKWGLFHSCFEEYEIVLADGNRVVASPHKNSDLYRGTACSYGSLGIITSAKLKLLPVKKFVHITYHPVYSFEEAVELIKNSCRRKDIGYVDAIVYSKNLGVIMTGKLSDGKNLPIATFLSPTNQWFYIHAKQIAENKKEFEELIPIQDYFFRYDRGAFWMGEAALGRLKIPSDRITHYIYDSLLKAKALYRFLHAANLSQQFLVQDVSIPQEKVVGFMNVASDKWHIFPLWLCPLRPSRENELAPNNIETDLVVNVGIWGEVSHNYEKFMAINREFEKVLKRYGGRKTLYAHAYYKPKEFWEMYNKEWYDALRKKYRAKYVFPDIYHSTHVSVRLKQQILKGIASLIFKNPYKIST
jgi:Delta24-sterol reductase